MRQLRVNVDIDKVQAERVVVMLLGGQHNTQDATWDHLLGHDAVEATGKLGLDGNEDPTMVGGLEHRVVKDVRGELARKLLDVRIPTPNLLQECDVVALQKLGDKLATTTNDPNIPVAPKERSDIP